MRKDEVGCGRRPEELFNVQLLCANPVLDEDRILEAGVEGDDFCPPV